MFSSKSSTVIPIAISTRYCRGHIESKISEPWPENIAYALGYGSFGEVGAKLAALSENDLSWINGLIDAALALGRTATPLSDINEDIWPGPCCLFPGSHTK